MPQKGSGPSWSVLGADLTLMGKSHCWTRGAGLSCPEEASVLREFITFFFFNKGRFTFTFLPHFPLRSATEVCSFNYAPPRPPAHQGCHRHPQFLELGGSFRRTGSFSFLYSRDGGIGRVPLILSLL